MTAKSISEVKPSNKRGAHQCPLFRYRSARNKTILVGTEQATFESGDDRLTFLITIPIHEGCEKKLMSVESSEKHDEMSVENNALSVEMSVETNVASEYVK